MPNKTGEACVCDHMRFLFPEYHWPHCRRNPKRIGGFKDKLSHEPQVLMAVSQPARKR